MKHIKIHLLLFLIGLVFSTMVPNTVYALIAADNQSFNLNFRFNSPGARANGMGGAFIGVADDATAAYTNPAGLTILTEPEVSIENKYGDYDNTFTLFGPPNSQDFTETSSGFSFLSLVHPTEKATFSVYRHELINTQNEDDFDQYANYVRMERDINAVTYGVGLGFKIIDSLSLGWSVGFVQMSYYGTTEIFSDPSFSPPPDTRVLIDGEDISTQFNLSLLWNPVGSLNVGLVYRQGPEFKFTYEFAADTGGDDDFDEFASTKYTIKVPDVYGAGISYRFNFGLTIAADVNYIEYSDLLKDFRFPDGNTSFGGISTSDFDVDDTLELHAGIEYVFSIGNTPVAVRGGYTHKPDHRIHYTGSTAGALVGWKNWAPEGDDDNIFALGLGFVVSEQLQIDGAASFGDFEKEYTVSLVYRF
jgi:long-subunit fatty acid transport protein